MGRDSGQAGNALLITMVLVAVIGTVAFGVARTTLSSLRGQLRHEDSHNAYTAATAGIEDGLLRWRFSKDAQAPTLNCSLPNRSSRFVERVNLTRGQAESCLIPDETPVPSPDELVYDLKIAYHNDPGRKECISAVASEDCSQPVGGGAALEQDQIAQYRVANLTSSPARQLVLKAVPDGYLPGTPLDPTLDFIEIIALGQGGDVLWRHLLDSDDIRRMNLEGPLNILNPAAFGVTSADPTAPIHTIRFKPLGRSLERYELSVPDASSDDLDLVIDGRITHIEATGYFGGVKRKLHVALDRSSGQLLELYDFVLFADQGDIQPQNLSE